MSADGPDPSGDFGRGRSIIDQNTGEYADVIAGALKVTSTGGSGTNDQGEPNTPDKAWPVKATDAGGVNQSAITVAGDTKVTLDGETIDVNVVSGSGGGLTDAELRATPVPVDTGLVQPTTPADTQPISAASLPLPSGASTEATLALIKAKTDNLDVLLSTRTKPADQQHVIIDSSASIAVTGPLTDAQLRATPVPVSGTVSTGGLTNAELRASAVPISAASLPLPAGAATLAGQTQPGVDIGDVTINNAVGAGAVNIQDGGNSITVDGPLTDTQLRAADVKITLDGEQVDISDRAARDNGKIDIALLDQYTPVSGRLPVHIGSGLVSVVGQEVDNASVSLGKLGVLVANSSSVAPSWGENRQAPLSVQLDGYLRVDATGENDQDALITGRPVLVGGFASAAAPTAVGSDGVAVRAWHLRNGAAATVLTAAGALIGGDAANGLDVDVTRLPAPLSTANRGVADATVLRVVQASELIYRAATINNVVAPAQTKSFFVIAGSASKTIRVRKVRFSGNTPTTLAANSVECRKLSSQPSAGTVTTLTKTPLDSNDAAATANLCQVYTTTPTTDGALVGTLGTVRGIQKSSTTVDGASYMDVQWDFGDRGVVLRGTAQCLSLAFGAAPAATTLIAVEVEWSEE